MCVPIHYNINVFFATLLLQLYLQRLNYLSTMHKLDGVFTNATQAAVTKFQLAHNVYESKYSVLLPENGYLTAATLAVSSLSMLVY